MEDNKFKSLKDLENPEAWKDLYDQGKEIYTQGMQKVGEYPMMSVAVAAGLGFIIGVSGFDKTARAVQANLRPQFQNLDPMGIFMNALNGFSTRRYNGTTQSQA